MADSIQRATSDGTLQMLSLSIAFFDQSEITVLVGDVPQVLGEDYRWESSTTIFFLRGPVASGVEVTVRRTTYRSKTRHVFSAGSPFTYKTLDEDFTQILRISQEAVEGLYVGDLYNNLNMHGYRISNLGDAVGDTEGMNLRRTRTMLEQGLAGVTGGAGWFQQSGSNMPQRTYQDKMRDSVSPLDAGAVGDGATDDSAAFNRIRAAHSGKVVDLCGRTYLVAALPSGCVWVNGFFSIDGNIYDANQNNAMITSATDTGGLEAAYQGGTNGTPTKAGRSTLVNRAMIAVSNCRAMFVRSALAACIYTWVKGNVAFAAASRQGVIEGPQGGLYSTEECRSFGFRAHNVGSVFCAAVVSSGGNYASRLGRLGGSYVVNVATNTCRIGAGRNAELTVTIVNGVVTSVNIVNGGTGYVVADTDPRIVDRSSYGTGASFTFTVNSSGTITSTTLVSGGSGYTLPESVIVQLDQRETTSAILASSLSNIQGALCADALIAGSTGCNIRNATQVAILASDASEALGNRTFIGGSSGSSATGVGAFVLGSTLSHADAERSGVLAGRRVRSNNVGSLVKGDSPTGSASTANKTLEHTLAGNLFIKGQLTPGATFTDYAEMFENYYQGVVIPLGTIVTRIGTKVLPAKAGDKILGVISATAAVCAGDTKLHAATRHLYDAFDQPLLEVIPCVSWEGRAAFAGTLEHARSLGVVVPDDATHGTRTEEAEDAMTGATHTIRVPTVAWPAIEGFDGAVTWAQECGLVAPENAVYKDEVHQVINPDYDPDLENVPRSERPAEWSCVGLVGQLRVRVGKDVKPEDYVAADGSVSDTPTPLQCMAIRAPYDESKGYAVALCIRV